MSSDTIASEGTAAVKLMPAEVGSVGRLMMLHEDCEATITIADVLGRRVLVVGFSEGDDARDPTVHAYLVTYHYDTNEKRYLGQVSQL